MSEKIPQSNPENHDEKLYLIPIADDQVVFGTVNFRRQKIGVSKRIEGPDMMITHIEVAYETQDGNGDPVTVTKWVSDHHFKEVGQMDLLEKYLKSINTNDNKE